MGLAHSRHADEVVRLPVRGVREPWVRKAQLAAHFQVHEKTIERWVAAGMPVIRGKRLVRFQVSACESWLESQG